MIWNEHESSGCIIPHAALTRWSKDILDHAANWYGTSTTPNSATAITVTINMPSMSDDLRSRLRTIVRHAE